MLRELLGAAILLTLPGLVAAQASVTPTQPARNHGVATSTQGNVVLADEMDGRANQVGGDEADGANNQEGVDEADGQNNDGAFEQDGVDEPDGINNDVNEVGEQNGDQDSNVDPTPVEGQKSRVGSHRP